MHDADGHTLIALGILEAVEVCTRASEMVDRLDGTYIHDDWGEEQFVFEPWRIADSSDEVYKSLPRCLGRHKRPRKSLSKIGHPIVPAITRRLLR